MISGSFSWSIEFPSSKDPIELSVAINKLVANEKLKDSIISKKLSEYKESMLIKGYKCNVQKNLFYFNKFGIVDLAKDNELRMLHCEYTIYLYKEGLIKPIPDYRIIGWQKYYRNIENYNSNESLIRINKPWRVEIKNYKTSQLKTQINVRIEFEIFLDPADYKIQLPLQNRCNHNFRLISYRGLSVWKLAWECVLCGIRCHCSCIKAAVEKEALLDDRGAGVDLPFYDNACEVCRGVPSTHVYGHQMYARSQFELKYGAYVKKKVYEIAESSNDLLDKEIEQKASNLVRDELGFKKIGKGFVVETELYRIVRKIFPDDTVIHHYRNAWLGRQEIDIFILGRKIGIEYQGEQHFKPIKAWGDTEGLSRNIERDNLKKRKCKKAGVPLVEFTYKEIEKLSPEYVKEKILGVLKQEPSKEVN